MTLLLNDDEVRQLLDMPRLVAALDTGFRDQALGRVNQPERFNLPISSGLFRVMPCVVEDPPIMGLKVFYRGKDGVRYLVSLYDQTDGPVLALMDGRYLSAARTGATTGVATRYLARSDSRVVGLLGSGLEARTNLAGVCAVRDITHVRVYSPTTANREKFAVEQSQVHGIEVTAVDSPRQAVEGADIVVAATRGRLNDPQAIVEGPWLEPGMHVNGIGATIPALRELHGNSFLRADLVVMDSIDDAVGHSGDVHEAVAMGWDASAAMLLHELIGDADPAESRDSNEITLFKSMGTALQDTLAAHIVYERARTEAVGVDLGDFLVAS